jgi:hypothetical protein
MWLARFLRQVKAGDFCGVQPQMNRHWLASWSAISRRIANLGGGEPVPSINQKLSGAPALSSANKVPLEQRHVNAPWRRLFPPGWFWIQPGVDCICFK